jgi:uncharacterized protein YjbK
LESYNKNVENLDKEFNNLNNVINHDNQEDFINKYNYYKKTFETELKEKKSQLKIFELELDSLDKYIINIDLEISQLQNKLFFMNF